jgi:transcriptional regulator with XRE-family HTH domain
VNYHKLGQRIRDERVRFKMTQEQLAEVLGLSSIFIGQIERAERKMSIDTLIKISDCLHVSLDYLIRGGDSIKDEAEVSELIGLIGRCSNKELRLIEDIVKAALPHITQKDN